jgi:hypothetical protein
LAQHLSQVLGLLVRQTLALASGVLLQSQA